MISTFIAIFGFIVSIIHPTGVLIPAQNTLISKNHIESVQLDGPKLIINTDVKDSQNNLKTYVFVYSDNGKAKREYLKIKSYSN